MEPFRLPVIKEAMKTVALDFIERRLVGVPNGKQDAGGSGVGATPFSSVFSITWLR